MLTAPTPDHLRTDKNGRPYFVWDTDITWEAFVAKLRSEDQAQADYWLARGMRDAKPDDMVELVTWAHMASAWPRVRARLGRSRAFWAWWLARRGFDVANRRPPGVLVDTKHEILVNKLCALLSRSELRDLEDVRVLLDDGGDLERALADAPAKDGGFSPMVLAWVLQSLPLQLAAELGFDETLLSSFRRQLLQRLAPQGD